MSIRIETFDEKYTSLALLSPDEAQVFDDEVDVPAGHVGLVIQQTENIALLIGDPEELLPRLQALAIRLENVIDGRPEGYDLIEGEVVEGETAQLAGGTRRALGSPTDHEEDHDEEPTQGHRDA